MGLIIDDGVPSRGHRKAVFSSDYKYIGCSSRVTKDNKVITVINYHSDNVKLINKDKKNLQGGGQKKNISSQPIAKKGFDDFSTKITTTTVSEPSQPKIVSQSTSTKTKTCNGKTTKVVTKKIKYSDGTEE